MNDAHGLRILADSSLAPVLRHQLTRRGFIGTLAALGAAGVLTACSPGGKGAPAPQATGGDIEKTLSVYSWGEYDAPEVVEAFTNEHGAKVVMDTFASNEEMIAKLVAAKGTSGYDLVVPTGTFIPQMIENGLLAKLNTDLIPNIEHMDPAFLGREWDPENEYSICKAWGTTGFVYDKTVITRELKTWSDFIDAAQNEASGKTSLLDDPAELTGLYFWANGIDWTTTDAEHLDACEKFLVEELAPHVSAFDSYPGGSAIPQASHVLLQAWNGDARIGMLESPDPDRWQWVLGAPDTEIWMDNWALAAGAPHPEAAHAFLNYILTPENQLTQVDYIGYHTGAKGIKQAAEEAGVERLDMIFFTEEQIATMHEGAVTEAQERIVDIWNKTKAAAGA
ncbi:polyamine ABC transporter substrate-binding protein [Microbacterium sp.]|uniref:polyamine ABC transporter substrate-binding protein n=1 Tax=Microbacterium sp. TaxID=51671 RepID=UPI002811DEB4|nr:extracellular solute-binding protein [Microbacterium sp.]